MAPRRNAQSTAAELSLVHLKNCLVNLPASLVNLLVNVNTVRQLEHYSFSTSSMPLDLAGAGVAQN